MKGIVIPTNLGVLGRLCARQEATRFCTTGVRVIDLNGAYRLEATDGRKLCIVRGNCAEGAFEAPSPLREFTVPAKDWQDALAALSKIKSPARHEPPPAWLSADKGTFAFEGNGYRKTGDLLEGRWPRTDDVLPKGRPLVTVRVKPQLVVDLCQVALALGCESVALHFYATGRPDTVIPVALSAANEQGQFIDAVLVPLANAATALDAPARPAPSAPGSRRGVAPEEDPAPEVELDEPDRHNGTNGAAH